MTCRVSADCASVISSSRCITLLKLQQARLSSADHACGSFMLYVNNNPTYYGANCPYPPRVLDLIFVLCASYPARCRTVYSLILRSLYLHVSSPFLCSAIPCCDCLLPASACLAIVLGHCNEMIPTIFTSSVDPASVSTGYLLRRRVTKLCLNNYLTRERLSVPKRRREPRRTGGTDWLRSVNRPEGAANNGGGGGTLFKP